MRLTVKRVTWLKALLHLAAFLPFVWLVVAVNSGWLSADPAKDIQHFTGRMALKLLLATLAISPLATLTKEPLLVRTRRLLGLWCFAWAVLHLSSYLLLELGVNNLSLFWGELIKRPYMLLGSAGLTILSLLAVTSTRFAQNRLGKRWQTLHNFVYLALILGVIHYIWSVKILSPQPIIYGLCGVVLLLLRYKKFRRWVKR